MKRTAFILTAVALAALSISTPIYASGGGQPGAHFIENWDYDEDGKVTLAELEERRGDIFTTFDENDDEFLDASEYVAFDAARAADMESEGNGGGHCEKKAQKGFTIAYNDTNNDGKVSRDEFVAGTAPWFAEMDRNGDGAITTKDFGRK